MSPAEPHLFDWLYATQRQVPTTCFWLDLLCIDQSWEDEAFSASQLQLIPAIFGVSGGIGVDVVRGRAVVGGGAGGSHVGSGGERAWKGLLGWMEAHGEVCACSPLTDAWMTRVWTRQELLYSKRIVFYSALEWVQDGRGGLEIGGRGESLHQITEDGSGCLDA